MKISISKSKSIKTFLFPFLLGMCFFTAQVHAQVKAASKIQTSKSALVLKNLRYGHEALQDMDVYLLPDRNIHTPLVIIVHGGGWMAGDKKDADFMKDFMMSKGFNVINLNYRLGNQTNIHYQEIIKDMDKAIKYAILHAREWNIRKSRYVFWGGSAGGHLALLYAYRYDPKNNISAVISLGGPTKLDDQDLTVKAKKEDLEGLLPIVTGHKWTPGSLAPAYQSASPFYSSKFVPSMLVHGEKDAIVPNSQARLMAEELDRKHIDHQLIILPNAGHGGEGAPEEDARNLQEKMTGWVKKYSK